MDDFYIEQIVPRKKPAAAVLIRTVWLALVVTLAITGVLFGAFILLVAALVVGFAGYYLLLPELSVEYEYLYMSKELSVDRILDKQKRKKAGSYDLTGMEVMAPMGSDRLQEYEGRNPKVVNYSSRRADAKCYGIILGGQNLTKLVIEPDERLLKALKDQFPRKVYTE